MSLYYVSDANEWYLGQIIEDLSVERSSDILNPNNGICLEIMYGLLFFLISFHINHFQKIPYDQTYPYHIVTSTKTLSGTNRKTTRSEFFCETYNIKSTFRQMLILYHMIAIPLNAHQPKEFGRHYMIWFYLKVMRILHIQRPFCYPLMS